LPEARGGALGIVSGHGPAHLVRAALESVAYEYRAALSAIGPLSEPVMIGDGEARSELWNQVKADVTNLSLRVPEIVELAAAGAAILAGVAAGVFEDMRAGTSAIVRTAKVVQPDPGRHQLYRELAVAYERAIEALRPGFGAAVPA
jgi:xylulokinase